MNYLSTQLREDGYVFLPQWDPAKSTTKVCDELPTVLSWSAPTRGKRWSIDSLRPRDIEAASKSHYSGIFGLRKFPLHTDLAHWSVPPRYLVLRCVVGAPEVTTIVLPANSELLTSLRELARRAVFRPRKGTETRSASVLPFLFRHSGIAGMRWDSVFLLPMNSVAQRLAELMRTVEQEDRGQQRIRLIRPGDTLIIDNWRALHGRSNVPPTSDSPRLIERVYISAE